MTIPSAVRDRLDVEPGDKLRWRVAEDGRLEVEVDRYTRLKRSAGFELVPVDGITRLATADDPFE